MQSFCQNNSKYLRMFSIFELVIGINILITNQFVSRLQRKKNGNHLRHPPPFQSLWTSIKYF